MEQPFVQFDPTVGRVQFDRRRLLGLAVLWVVVLLALAVFFLVPRSPGSSHSARCTLLEQQAAQVAERFTAALSDDDLSRAQSEQSRLEQLAAQSREAGC